MMFYNEHLLADHKELTRIGEYGWLISPTIEEFLDTLRKAPKDRLARAAFYKDLLNGRFQPKDISIKISNRSSTEKLLYLTLNYSFEGTNRSYTLASCTISTTPSNCSALFISAMQCDYSGCGVGQLLYKGLENWIRKAGYTFVYLSMAGDHQLDGARKFFRRNGFKRMAMKYDNPRSLNTNMWMYKLIGAKYETA